MKHGDRNRAVGLARIVFYDNGRIEPRKAFEHRPEAVFGGEIPACRRAARLPQGRAEARVDEGARAPRCRILLQHSDEHAAMITAAVVTVVGSISYIGLIVPNLVSLLKGDDLRGTLPDTALAGALFVLLCDLAARTVVAPFELPIELIVGIVGSAVFIALILHRLRCGRRALTLANVKSLFTFTSTSASTPGAR